MDTKQTKIPKDLHRRVKIESAKQGIQIKQFIEKALKEALKRK